jgi:hypothetical protein
LKHHMTSLLSIFLLLSLSIAKHVLLSKYYSIILPWIVYANTSVAVWVCH